MIDFSKLKTTCTEFEIIHLIAKRRVEMARKMNVEDEVTTAAMDIEVTHHNCPLKLQELLKADDADFGHDVFGIRRHLNRETGKLENHFHPRYAAPELEAMAS